MVSGEVAAQDPHHPARATKTSPEQKEKRRHEEYIYGRLEKHLKDAEMPEDTDR